ncbi:MAG: hypothetical protein ACLP8S_19770 [Solirubrobacteraceae bacterium]
MASFDVQNPFGLPDLGDEDRNRLRGHIEGLADRHGLEWREREVFWLDAEGDIAHRWFESPIVRTEFDYLAGLHEVGHHVLALPTFDKDRSVAFDNEVDVWQWALAAEAVIETSEGARTQVLACLISYPDQPLPQSAVDRLRAIAPFGGEAVMGWRDVGT